MARFRKGTSGNPAGRAKGTKNKRTLLAERAQQVFSTKGAAVAHKVVEAALGGDMDAARLILDRVVPPLRPRDRLAKFQLPRDLAADPGALALSFARAASNAEITPAEAAALATLTRFNVLPAVPLGESDQFLMHVGLRMPPLRHSPMTPEQIEAMERSLTGEVEPVVEALPSIEPAEAAAEPAAVNSHLRRRPEEPQ